MYINLISFTFKSIRNITTKEIIARKVEGSSERRKGRFWYDLIIEINEQNINKKTLNLVIYHKKKNKNLIKI